MTDFFVVNYQSDDRGCPAHLSGEVNHEEWEWDQYEADPWSVAICQQYTYKVTDHDLDVINFDFYSAPTTFVSKDFIDICNQLSVHFRPVPLDIFSSKRIRIEKSYYIFLPGDFVALMNREESKFAEEIDLETGKVAMLKSFPNNSMYSWIRRFVPQKDLQTPHLFMCLDILTLVCTSTFKTKAEESGLVGLKFLPLDETYRFDPWSELEP